MNKLKTAVSLLCLVVTLGAGAGELSSANEPTSSMSPMAVPSDKSVKRIGVKTKADWANISRLQSNATENKLMVPKSTGLVVASATDGVYLNIDSLPSNWESQIKSALAAGQVVVLQTFNKSTGPVQMEKMTLAVSRIGVQAAAAMLYQAEEPDGSVSVMPFGFHELDRLASLMPQVGRRSSTPTSASVSQ